MEQLSLELETILEVVRVRQEVQERPIKYKTGMISSTYAGEFGIREIGDEASEVVLVVVLNTKNEINAIHRTFAGSLNTSVAHPREIFRTAILNNGARVMLYHNHPSGNTEPSNADLSFTRRIIDAGELLGIEVVDHIIVTGTEYYSLREANII
ncbi:JAB domain-containing protein [Alkalibacterium olivapovliticus]|uniref:DNA repair protein RadC n=1 Tax=Alkalibacterium olivapovliticus TaxID=99907 RepID=A0A2T0VU20_9LACT|nr:JAB domain-containing protein [Alkalibacterium olivapovliticus]PRY74844.1 DNA repair protein RadC [Alkalibacterium olivapovliticus]